MADLTLFREAFDKLAHNGAIGDPNGTLSYGYLRVSSNGQAEEGRSGLPRQIENCHEAALRVGLKIPWELIFADDDSGFQFKKRPALSTLREEFMSKMRRADHIVIESLDRLSRHADWHQGFLLDEMKEWGLTVVFWKDCNSRVERAVMGAIAQDGMEQSLQRMKEGNLYKARDGRVTARTPAFGYSIVDGNGKASADARKDTHYALCSEEAKVVEMIYRKIAIEGASLRQLAVWLDDYGRPPKQSPRWNTRTLLLMLRNPLYKGEFYAHRYTYMKEPAVRQRPGRETKFTTRKVERPRDEWIAVPVPPIVSPELWEKANRVLDRNAIMSRRHASAPYLLTGLVKCAGCGYSYVGKMKKRRKGGKEYLLRSYRCNGSNGLHGVFRDVSCTESQISCTRLDTAVWKAVSNALLHPELLIEALEHGYQSGPNAEILAQIQLLEGQLADLDAEDGDLYRAYRAKAFNEQEFATKRQELKERREKIKLELGALKNRVMSQEELELNKEKILAQSQLLKEQELTPEPLFEVKQTILKLVVDQIKLNVDEGWFEIEGLVPGHYFLEGTESIAPIPVDRDWPRPRA